MPAPDDALKLLANETTRALVAQLARAPSYPRALAATLHLSEGDVQRRLHRLARAGIVVGEWRHREKTIKEYALCASSLALDFATGSVHVRPADVSREA